MPRTMSYSGNRHDNILQGNFTASLALRSARAQVYRIQLFREGFVFALLS